MDKQKIFEFTIKKMFEQGERAYGRPEETEESNLQSSEMCLYRHGDLKCAFGMHIPDALYDPSLEGLGAPDVVYRFQEAKCINGVDVPDYLIDRANTTLFSELQTLHDIKDNWNSSETMRLAAREVGRELYLDVSFIDELSFKDR